MYIAVVSDDLGPILSSYLLIFLVSAESKILRARPRHENSGFSITFRLAYAACLASSCCTSFHRSDGKLLMKQEGIGHLIFAGNGRVYFSHQSEELVDGDVPNPEILVYRWIGQ